MPWWLQFVGPFAVIAIAAAVVLAMQYGERKGRAAGQQKAEDEEQLRSLHEATLVQEKVVKAKAIVARRKAEGKVNADIKKANDQGWVR